MIRGVVLLAHGSRDPAWAAPIVALKAEIERGAHDLRVELAFLEMMSPDLCGAIDRLVAVGVARVHVAPLFLGQGSHAKRDVAHAVTTARQARPDLPIEVLESLGEASAVRAALARWILSASG